MIFRCTIHRQSSAFGYNIVEADSPEQAREIAERRCRDGMVNMVEAGDEYAIDTEQEESNAALAKHA